MKQTRELFSKQMTRKEFLQLTGVVVLSAIGVTNFISNFKFHANRSGQDKVVQQQASRGFGSSKFGV